MTEKEDKGKKRRIYKKLKNKYRLVILNDDTFEERFSFILSPLNVYFALSVSIILIVGIVWSLIAYTPIRELVPGYAEDADIILLAAHNERVIDSLEKILRQDSIYIAHKKVRLGDSVISSPESSSDPNINYSELEILPVKGDSVFRRQFEAQNTGAPTFSPSANPNSIGNFFFFTPLKGLVSNGFNTRKDHYGVDIVAKKDEPIKAILDGTVTMATWTLETGHVIQLQHSGNLVSIYKHNSVLLKKIGDRVKAGDAIAIIGDSGEQSTGPHLHFELWLNGAPIDPQDYINFN